MKAHQPCQGPRPMAGFFCFFWVFFFQSGIYFRCCLDNSRRFPNFQLPTIGVTADFYILHFLDNRRCSYTIKFFNANTIFAADGLVFTHTYKVLQDVRRHGSFKVLWHFSICSHFSIHTLKVT
jgi:hypothetical protein